MNGQKNSRFVKAITPVLLIFMLAPLLVVISISVSDNFLATFPPKGFTFEWYGRVIADAKFQHAFTTSLVLAITSTLTALLLAAPAAIVIHRGDLPGCQMLETLLLSPMILPILITGLAILQFFSLAQMYSVPLNLYIGHILIIMPYMLRTLLASFKQIDHRLEEAATTLGASPIAVFWHVTLPQIMPGVFAGCLFAFLVSFDDFPVSFWLADAGTEPLPIYLHHALSRVFDPSIAAISSLMILTSVVTILALERFVGIRKAMGI
ncbi:putative spermidine/putrescine transport system permease protein [Erwinia toletana]|uniref:Spermidine/putrescine transport system permease protein n=1 Tax=Winslowiella toletana TaxID=92490 RepID=A0ABS4P2C7_9GAMM|nr:ABC transporter permease [Winslowiella toletana]MBP2166821.1 putative spermidine/putrescine transport system permease protein [Winslowiella toletana]